MTYLAVIPALAGIIGQSRQGTAKLHAPKLAPRQVFERCRIADPRSFTPASENTILSRAKRRETRYGQQRMSSQFTRYLQQSLRLTRIVSWDMLTSSKRRKPCTE
jgi:hypothetical protein